MRGYTVFEVMVVLAVTSVIFFTATLVFSDRQSRTQFNQAMYDLQSRFQAYANQVSTGTFPGTTLYDCEIANSGNPEYNRPILRVGGGAQSTDQDCLYLGKAIQVIRGATDSRLYIHNIFGLRTIYGSDCSADTGFPVTNLLQTCPSPGVHPSRNFYRLMETYNVLDGFRILSSKYAPTNLEAGLLQFYTSFQSGTASSQGMTAYTVEGNFSAYPPGPPGDRVNPTFLQCLELLNNPTPNCANPKPIGFNGWKLCVQEDGANRKAELTVLGTSTGITTKLNLASTCT
jgi:Tfp pilus assembly protein PilE